MTLYCWHVDIAACSYGLTLVQSSGQGSPAINTWHGVIICVNYATASWKVQYVLQVGSEHFYSKDSFRWQFFLHLNCKIDSLCNCCKALLWQPLKKTAWKIENIIVFFFILYFFPPIFFYNKCFNLSYPTGFIKTRCIWDKLPIKKNLAKTTHCFFTKIPREYTYWLDNLFHIYS